MEWYHVSDFLVSLTTLGIFDQKPLVLSCHDLLEVRGRVNSA
jgi:hypothetical protein